jgi:hypothetical protein
MPQYLQWTRVVKSPMAEQRLQSNARAKEKTELEEMLDLSPKDAKKWPLPNTDQLDDCFDACDLIRPGIEGMGKNIASVEGDGFLTLGNVKPALVMLKALMDKQRQAMQRAWSTALAAHWDKHVSAENEMLIDVAFLLCPNMHQKEVPDDERYDEVREHLKGLVRQKVAAAHLNHRLRRRSKACVSDRAVERARTSRKVQGSLVSSARRSSPLLTRISRWTSTFIFVWGRKRFLKEFVCDGGSLVGRSFVSSSRWCWRSDASPRALRRARGSSAEARGA